MKKLIIGNWKMNPATSEEAEALFRIIERKLKAVNPASKVVVCPPFVFLPQLARLAEKITLGAQNVSWAEEGALTGEISASELKQLGIEYSIVGHSERRLYLGETDSVVNAKILELLKHKLTPVVCLGGEADAAEEKMESLVSRQLTACIKDLEKLDLKKLIYVYEPTWAISTMKNSRPATSAHALKLINHIRNLLANRIGKEADLIPVLYGGTVNEENVSEYARHPEISGALVGAASLEAENFWRIVEEFERESVHKI